jgi:hypothetical protein
VRRPSQPNRLRWQRNRMCPSRELSGSPTQLDAGTRAMRKLGHRKAAARMKLRFAEKCAVARPVVLTRCKSEPARVDYRIAPEVNINLWKKTRLGFAVTSSPHHILSD